MDKFEKKIDNESELAIKELAKASIQFIYSPSADVYFGSSIITVQNISIQIGRKKFVIIENDWDDTPEEWLDYYFLRARISDRPKDVTVKDSGYGLGLSYTMDHLSFNLNNLKRVSSISILEYNYVGEKEEIRYDAGLAISLEDGSRISIVREESITGFLQIALIPQDNNKLIEDLKTRIEYNA